MTASVRESSLGLVVVLVWLPAEEVDLIALQQNFDLQMK